MTAKNRDGGAAGDGEDGRIIEYFFKRSSVLPPSRTGRAVNLATVLPK
jgi:hypothetical protein